MDAFIKVMHFIFFLYFATHIPITILVDAMAVVPKSWYPQMVSIHVHIGVLVSLNQS